MVIRRLLRLKEQARPRRVEVAILSKALSGNELEQREGIPGTDGRREGAWAVQWGLGFGKSGCEWKRGKFGRNSQGK